MQEAHGNAAHVVRCENLDRCCNGLPRRRALNSTVGVCPSRHFQPQASRYERLRLFPKEIVHLGPIAPADLQNVAKTSRGDQPNLCAPPFEQRVQANRCPMQEILSGRQNLWWDMGRNRMRDAFLRRRRDCWHFTLDGGTCFRVKIDQVGECPADVSSDPRGHASALHFSRKCFGAVMRGWGAPLAPENRLDAQYKPGSILVMLKSEAPGQDPQVREIAAKLRSTRKDLSLTMQEVADRAGLSVGFISQVERAITVPSLGSLVSIAHVLDKPVSFFLQETVAEEETTRQSARVPFKVGEGSVLYERISADFAGRQLSSVIVNEPPGHRSEPISHEGEELMFILEGEVTLELDGERNVLRLGDSIHFSSRRVHSIWNHTEKMARVLWCGTMEIFDTQAPDPTHKQRR